MDAHPQQIDDRLTDAGGVYEDPGLKATKVGNAFDDFGDALEDRGIRQTERHALQVADLKIDLPLATARGGHADSRGVGGLPDIDADDGLAALTKSQLVA